MVDFATVVAWPVAVFTVTIDVVVISGALLVLVTVVVRVAAVVVPTLLPTLMLVLVACGFSARSRCLPWYGLSCLFTRVLPERGAHIHGVVGGYRIHVERRSRWFACLCRVLFVYTFLWTFQDQVQVLSQTFGGFVCQVYSIMQQIPVVDCSVCQMKGRVVSDSSEHRL